MPKGDIGISSIFTNMGQRISFLEIFLKMKFSMIVLIK